jgi:hypothetical protein
LWPAFLSSQDGERWTTFSGYSRLFVTVDAFVANGRKNLCQHPFDSIDRLLGPFPMIDLAKKVDRRVLEGHCECDDSFP